MIDQLRIKCPSCGIFLEVRNSKNEAVKRIVCPNCKKQLAVDFQEEQKPASSSSEPLGALYYGEMRIDLQEGVNQIPLPSYKCVEIKVARLNDGSNKCMVRPLDYAHPVKVNEQVLLNDDQVVLATGDRLQVENTVLVFNQPDAEPLIPKPTPSRPLKSESTSKPLSKAPNYNWVYVATALAAMIIAIIVIWPSKKPVSQKPFIAKADSVVLPPEPNKVKSPQNGNTIKNPKAKMDREKNDNDSGGSPLAKLGDYELEKKAGQGSVDAQLELGKRLVKTQGVNNIVRGINYLRLAAKNGSSEAKTVLEKAINILQRKADQGDSSAFYALMKID